MMIVPAAALRAMPGKADPARLYQFERHRSGSNEVRAWTCPRCGQVVRIPAAHHSYLCNLYVALREGSR